MAEALALRANGIGRATVRRDPAWPVYLLFLGLPLWWVLGISHFMWPVLAGFMALSLLVRRGVRIPGNFVIWALFLAWMLASTVAIDSVGRMMGFGLRFSFYAAAGVFFLYLYNSRQISSRAIAFALGGCWVLVVVGGFLGVLFPQVAFHTPVERIIPGSLLANDYVRDMTFARFAEFQDFLGQSVGRPATFFTYTNGWGSAFGLMAPFAVAALVQTRSRGWRRVLLATMVLSIVPVAVSLNRGLWISLVVGGLYAIFRFLGSRNAARAVFAFAVIAVAALVIAVTPLGGFVGQRFYRGASNDARESLYAETFARVESSPLIGYGAPRPAESSGYLDSVGTQGQVLYLVFSHGFPGLLLFFAWLGHAFLRSSRATTPAARAGHVTLLIAAVQAPFYGLLMQMFVIAAAAAVALRQESPAIPQAAPAPPGPARGPGGWQTASPQTGPA